MGKIVAKRFTTLGLVLGISSTIGATLSGHNATESSCFILLCVAVLSALNR